MRHGEHLIDVLARVSRILVVSFVLLCDGSRAIAQTCAAVGGVLGPNEFTAEVNGTFGEGTARNQQSPLLDPSVTSFLYQACGSPILPYPPDNGCYALTTRRTLTADYPANPNGGFAVWHRHAGHTTGSDTDKYLVVNASVEPGIYYRQTITGLTPGTLYEVGLWVLNLTDRDLANRILPNLAFQYDRRGVDDDGDGVVDEADEAITGFATGPIAETSTPVWVPYRFLFNSGTSDSVEFLFRNFAAGGSGNDISLDDITLKACSLPAPNSLSGTVFSDVNQDGVQDSGERGIGRVTVQLIHTQTGTTNTTETDANGHYVFVNVPVTAQGGGAYQIVVLASDTDLQGASPTLPNPPSRLVEVSAGSNLTGLDFGFNALADLQIVKTNASNTYIPGGLLSYTISVLNNGPSDANGATIADVFPAGTQASWTCMPSPGAACPAAGVGPLNAVVSLPRNGELRIVVTGTIASNLTGPLVNTATVAPPPGITDPIPANNTSTDTDTPMLVADLAISKFSAPSPFVPGSPLTYRITVSNLGPSDVAGASVSDTQTLAGFTWTCSGTGGGSCPASGGMPVIATVDLPAGATVEFVASGSAPAPPPDTLVNTATVAAPPGVLDPVPGNNQASDRNPIGVVADLSVSKRAVPSPYVAGAAFQYEIQVLNSGPGDVIGARLVDVLPAALASFTWTCTPVGSGVCRTTSGTGSLDLLLDLPALTRATLVVQGVVPPGTTARLENTAVVIPPVDVFDPVPGNNQDSSDSTPLPEADLRITKTVSPEPYVPGALLTYALEVSNAGPSDVLDARVRDALPPALRQFAWTCVNGPTGVCGATSGTGDIDALVDLPVNGFVTFTISGIVPVGTIGSIVNTATVTEPLSITDPIPGNNSAKAVTGGTLFADIGVTKTAAPLPAIPGQLLTYTITVSNAGPNDAPGVRVTDALPLPHRAFSWTCAANGGNCLTDRGSGSLDTFVSLPVSTSVVFTVSGTVPADALQAVENTVTAVPAGDIVDPNYANNTATVPIPVAPVANLSISKSSQPKPFEPGKALLYTITVANAGPSDAIDASLSDPVPPALAAFRWVCSGSPGSSCSPVQGVGAIAALATIRAGGTLTIYLFGDVPLDTSQPIVNTAVVTPPPGTTDPEPGNNTDTDNNLAVPIADIQVLKQVDNPAPALESVVTFTVTTTNAGPDAATGVAVTDRLPLGLVLVSATPSAGAFDRASGRWQIGDMPVGFAATLTLAARVTAAGTLVNEAIKTAGDQLDTNTSNNSASATVSPESPANVADISVEKRVSGRGLRAGEGVSFTVIVRNAGPAAATGVVVVDRLPSGLTFVSADPDRGAYDAMTGEWTIGDLSVDGSARMVVRALLETADPVTNVARKTGMNEVDPNTTNDADGVTVNGIFADIQVVKTVDRSVVSPGDVVTFSIVATNNGVAPATGVRIRELLPAGMLFLSATATQGTFVSGVGLWDVGELPSTGPASHATLTVSARALSSGTVTNTAAVFAVDQPDTNPANNSSSVDAAVLGSDLGVTVESITGDASVPGAPVDIYLAVTNQSANVATGPVTVALTMPDGVMFMEMAQSGWDCAFVRQTAFCTTDREIPAGRTIVSGFWTKVMHTLAPGSQMVASVHGVGDVDVSDNLFVFALTPGPGPVSELAVSQTASSTPETATFDVTVTNNGTDSATQVTLTDVLPPGVTLDAIAPHQGECAGIRMLACRIESLGPGASWRLRITLRAPPSAVIQHTVSVGSVAADPVLANNTSQAQAVLATVQPPVDTDGDGMPDEWEGLMGLRVSVNDASGDADGDGVSNLDEYLAGTHPRGFYRRLFAEGVSNTFINSHFAAMGMGTTGGAISYAFMRDDGATARAAYAVDAHRTVVVDAATIAGLAGRSFATLVESDQPFAADRLVNWGATGAHAERAIEVPSTTWYFAEGATGAFDLFYLIGNVEPVAADVSVTYLLESSPSVTKTYRIEPRSRLTIWVNDVAGLPVDSQGAVIRSSVPVLAERAMYLRPDWRGGHGGAGATLPATTWYFAEGATGSFFDCYILIVNPDPAAAEIEARFARSDGVVVTRRYTVPPERRLSIWVDRVDPALAATDVSTTITSLNGVGVVAERAMWWPEGAWAEGHASLGSVETATRWAIPDAFEGGPGGSATFVLISNPRLAPAMAEITVLNANGRERRRHVSLLPASRMTISIGEAFPELRAERYSVLVESLGSPAAPLAVECARYWSTAGVWWSSGVSALATPMR